MAPKSKQPRFSKEKNTAFTELGYLKFDTDIYQQAPAYVADTRARDAWLAEFWHLEPHLAGVLHSLISIDANRGWEMVGGRNQVMRYTEILHAWKQAPGLYGWRPGCSAAALSFYVSDLGGIIELGRDGKAGPVRKLYHVDPTRCRMTGSDELPLEYNPKDGAPQLWREMDFMRVASMAEIREDKNGIGYCFVSRTVILAQIMIAVYQHDQEQLGARAPRGLLLLMGITQQQWEQAMKTRKAALDGEGWKYYNAVAVLASMNASLDAKLVALSSLPTNFDPQTFTSLLMYGYALCAGYDPSEFWPVQYGSIGRGAETEVQHEKASGKGGKNFALALQESLQRPDVLPPTLEFQFDERDDKGELIQAQVMKAWADVFKVMRETGIVSDGQGAISRDEARVLYSERGLIPEDWAQYDTEAKATDEEDAEEAAAETPVPAQDQLAEELPVEATPVVESRYSKNKKVLREYLLSRPRIYEAAVRFPTEPIVRYRWPQDAAKQVWESGDDLLNRRMFARGIKRAVAKPLYESKAVTITEDDVDHAIETAYKVDQELGQILDNTPYAQTV